MRKLTLAAALLLALAAPAHAITRQQARHAVGRWWKDPTLPQIQWQHDWPTGALVMLKVPFAASDGGAWGVEHQLVRVDRRGHVRFLWATLSVTIAL